MDVSTPPSTTSSSRSWTIFLTSMIQSVLIFLFFWQGQDNDMPKARNMRGLVKGKSNQKGDIEEHLLPIEKTIEHLSSKILALNASVEGTLTGPGQKGSKPTETLRIKLRACISQITAVLAEIDQLGEPTVPVTDLSKIDEERKNLSAKRRILEQRLSPTTEKKITTATGKTTIEEVASQVVLTKVDVPVENSSTKKRERDSEAPAAPVEQDGRQNKKAKSVGRNNPYNSGSQQPSLKSLATGIEESTETDSSDYSTTESSSDGLPSLPSLPNWGGDLLAGLNRIAGSGSGSETDSETDSESYTSETSSSEEEKETLKFDLGDTNALVGMLSQFKKKEDPPPPSKTIPTKSSAAKKPTTGKSTNEKPAVSPKTTTPKSTEPAKSTTSTAATKKPQSPREEEEFDISSLPNFGKAKGRMLGKMMPLQKPPAKTSSTTKDKEPVKDTKKRGSGSSTKKADRTETKDKPKEKALEKVPEKPEKVQAKVTSPGRRVPTRQASVITDADEPGNTFNLFRRMNEIARKEAQGSDTPSEQSKNEEESEKSDDWSEDDGKEEVEPVELIASFGVKEDVNKDGMRRGKKGNNLAKAGQRYQMEDTNLALFPFLKNKNLGLFCVFDGHAGKGCSTALLKEFPAVFGKHWNAEWESKTDLTELWKTVYAEVDFKLKPYEYEGSTSTTVLIWRCSTNGKRYIQSANLGDSTSFLLRKDKCIALSTDHKPTIPAERERIQAMGIKLEKGQNRLNGLAVSRAFGDHFPKDINCGIISVPFVSPAYELTSKDTKMIVASDGLWDIVTGEKAFESIKSTKDPAVASRKLVKIAVSARECHDNVTAIVVNLS